MKKSNVLIGMLLGGGGTILTDRMFFRSEHIKEAEALRSELSIVRRQSGDLQRRIESGSAESTTLRTQLADAQKKLAAAEANSGASEAVTAQLKSAEAHAKAAEARAKTLDAQVAKLTNDNTALKTNLTSCEESCATANAENAALKAELAQLRTELEEVRTDLAHAQADDAGTTMVATTLVAEVVGEPIETVSAEPDNLRRIEGIGPKINSILNDAGITTFAQLAAAKVDDLSAILKAAEIRGVNDPTTWPEQADLASKGAWDELNALQDSLKGGRRV